MPPGARRDRPASPDPAPGITFIAEVGGGLYWLLPTVAASLLGGLMNAWLFLVREP